MKNLDKEALALWREIMRANKIERKLKSILSNRELAKTLEITENYFSALESTRAIPSVKVLMKYLIACGFDTSPLKCMVITSAPCLKPQDQGRRALIQKIYSFSDEQIDFLVEQVKLIEGFSFSNKAKRPTK